MKEKFFDLLHLSLPKRLGILAAILGVFVAAFYFLYLSVDLAEVEQLDSEIEGLQMQVSKKKGMVANLTRYKEEVKRLDDELAKALRELPDKKSIENLLTQISDKARNAGLDIELFRPSPEKLRDFYAEIPVKLKVIGSFHQLASFFNEVGDLDRIVNLSEYKISLKNLGKEEISLESELTATSFRFLDESERAKVEKSSGRKKKKRGKKKK